MVFHAVTACVILLGGCVGTMSITGGDVGTDTLDEPFDDDAFAEVFPDAPEIPTPDDDPPPPDLPPDLPLDLPSEPEVPSCTDQCASGQKSCADAVSYKDCIQDGSGCWVWSGSQSCGSGNICQGNACVPNPGGCVPEGPSGALECRLFELTNQDRAEHYSEAPGLECPDPLQWDASWAQHGRTHSQEMADRGGLFHADFPGGQNCAMAGSVEDAQEMFMWWPDEDPCPAYSHHCNLMTCDWTHLGIGIIQQGGYLWITENFY